MYTKNDNIEVKGSLSMDFICEMYGVDPAELTQALQDLSSELADSESTDSPT